MADLRAVFTPVEDDTTGEGQALPARQIGDVVSAKNGHIVLAWRDNAGLGTMPTLNADGTVPVSFDSGTDTGDSDVATPGALNTDTVVADVTSLTISKAHKLKLVAGSSFYPVEWRVVQTDDATTTELYRFLTGPGDFNHGDAGLNIPFTTGASGTQKIELIGQQIRGPLTDMHGTICINEAP